MPTSFYDVVVIGDDLAGAVAAAHLSRRGYRTLVACSTPTERDQLDEYALPRAPLPLTGLESPALRRLSGELHLLQLLRRRVEPLSPAYQLLLPDHRIDVSEDDLSREVNRELPGDSAAIEAWNGWAAPVAQSLESLVVEDVTLPPDGFWDRRDLKRIAARLPADRLAPPLSAEAALLSALPARFASDLCDPSAIATARLADAHRRGTFRLDGGREALRSLILDRVKTYAGEMRFDTPLRALTLRRGRAVGVVLGHQEEAIGCGQVVWAHPAAELLPYYPGKPPRRLAAAAAVPEPLRRYLLHLCAPLEALPDGLARLAFSVRDPRAALEGDNALALHLTVGPGAYAVLTVEALARDASPHGLLALRQGIRAHVATVVPFLDRHLRAVWSPHDGLPPEHLAIAPSAVPPTRPMQSLIDLPAPRPLGVCGLPHESGIKRLLFCNRQVMPGLGFEGELLAGWGAARLIAARDRKRIVDKGELLGT